MLDDFAARNELIAIAILIMGAILARLASAGVGRLLSALDRRTARLATTDDSVVSPQLIGVTRTIVFWLILVLAVTWSLRALGVGDVSTLLSRVVEFVPQLLVGFIIVVAGHVVGLIAGHVVAGASDSVTTDSLGPRLLHGAFILVGVVMGLQQISVDISFVTQLLLIVIAIAGGGLMLAFALGARQHVANLLARREMERMNLGDRIRIGDTEGEVVAIHATGLDLATADGVATIPAALLASSVVLRIQPGAGRD